MNLWASTGYVTAPTVERAQSFICRACSLVLNSLVCAVEVAKFGMREVEKMQNFEIENINLMKNFIQRTMSNSSTLFFSLAATYC
jgi:hypothetical protein